MAARKVRDSFELILRSRKPPVEKATRIARLAPTLPESALPVMDRYLEAADPLVQVAIMDAYFELTGDDYHEQDLIAIMDAARRDPDSTEDLYLAARVALGRLHGDLAESWQAPKIVIQGIRAPRRKRLRRRRRARQDSISIVVHGTWAADARWWRPGGDFFDYVKTELGLDDLYSGPDRFVWSGHNSQIRRREAGVELTAWLRSHPAAEINVFAHSHGANVAMLSTWEAVSIRRLVMMSPPVRSAYLADWRRVDFAYNIQARFDPVVAIAQGGQWFYEHGRLRVAELGLEASGHSASRDPSVWRDEQIARFIGHPWPARESRSRIPRR